MPRLWDGWQEGRDRGDFLPVTVATVTWEKGRGWRESGESSAGRQAVLGGDGDGGGESRERKPDSDFLPPRSLSGWGSLFSQSSSLAAPHKTQQQQQQAVENSQILTQSHLFSISSLCNIYADSKQCQQ